MIDRDTTWSFARNKIYLFATTRWINNLSTIFEVEIEIDDLRLELLPFLFSRSCVERTNEIYSRRLNISSSKMWRRGGKKFWPKVDIILEMKIKSDRSRIETELWNKRGEGFCQFYFISFDARTFQWDKSYKFTKLFEWNVISFIRTFDCKIIIFND